MKLAYLKQPYNYNSNIIYAGTICQRATHTGSANNMLNWKHLLRAIILTENIEGIGSVIF